MMCHSGDQTILEQLDLLESEMAHILADALFLFLKGAENVEEDKNVNSNDR